MNHLGPLKRIHLVGASVRAIAASACQAGFEAVAADLFADLDLRRLAPVTQLSRYPWSAYRWLAEAEVDAWCYTGGLENYPRLIQRMAGCKPLLGNGPDCLRRVRDPFWLAERLAQQGFAFPEVRHTLDCGSFLPRGGWLRKPWRSGGGLNIEPVDFAESGNAKFYLQKQVTGEARSVALLSSPQGVEVLGVCRLAVGPAFGAPGAFIFAGASSLPCSEVAEIDELRGVAQLLHETAALRGLWGFDYVLAGRPWLLEVNPRWTATMALHDRARVWGRFDSFMGRHVAACLGTDAQHLPPATAWPAMQIIYAAHEITVTDAMIDRVAGSDTWKGDRMLLAPTVADLPVPGVRIEPGQPVCTVYADGDTEEETMRRLADLVAEVRDAFGVG